METKPFSTEKSTSTIHCFEMNHRGSLRMDVPTKTFGKKEKRTLRAEHMLQHWVITVDSTVTNAIYSLKLIN